MLKTIFNWFKMSKPKVIVIAGTTGVGKSDLSIQLARKFNGEVINSDSMQMYQGIPIITNKHPIPERLNIRHHVMNHVPWNDEYFIHRFEAECSEVISDIHQRGKVPIIVGGTHYYLQTLFDKSVDYKVRSPSPEQQKILDSDNAQLVYENLKLADPAIANKFHINDTRRVRRMLEIFYTTGVKPSTHYSKQKNILKYDTLFLWIYSDPQILDQRLDDRVDKMVGSGALTEINELYEYYKAHGFNEKICENGVWQVIGFKEFLPWLEDKNTTPLEECIDRMKIRTRQYAKKQVKWIRKMLIPDLDGHVYLLNATNLADWNESVLERSTRLVDDFMNGDKSDEPLAPQSLRHLLHYRRVDSATQKDFPQYTCEICKDKNNKSLVAIGATNWEIHLKSRRHKSNLKRKNKTTAYDEWQKKKLDDKTLYSK